jgi:signal peptidase I
MIYITTPCTVVGSSMDPTFKDGDRLLCTDLFYTPTRGDIIVFDAQNYTELDSFFIKRTIAIEGDMVKLGGPDMNEVSINNQAYSDISKDEFVRIRKSAGITDDTQTSFLIPPGMQLVMGDNRGNSHDSRKFGLIKNEDVFGRVYMRVFPFTGIHFY